MGFLDKLKSTATQVKDKAVETVDDHGPQIKGGISKAGAFMDKTTKGKYSETIAKGTKKAEDTVDKIDKSDDKKPAAGGESPGSDHPNPSPGTAPPPPPDPAP